MKCENCDDKLPFPSMAQLWNEYRVGGPSSEERMITNNSAIDHGLEAE